MLDLDQDMDHFDFTLQRKRSGQFDILSLDRKTPFSNSNDMEMEHESPILQTRNPDGQRQSRNSASILYRGNETTDLMGHQVAS